MVIDPVMATIEEESVTSSLMDSVKRVITLSRKNAMVLIRNYL